MLVSAEASGDKPSKYDSHEKLGGNDTENDDERGVEDDLRGHAANAVGINGTDTNDVGETVHIFSVSGADDLHGDVLPLVAAVASRELIEQVRVVDLGGIEPIEEVEVEHIAVKDTEIAGLVAHLVPFEVDLAFAQHTIDSVVARAVEHVASIILGVAETAFCVPSGVDIAGAVLIEEVAGKVPSHSVAVGGDAGVCCRSDDVETALVHNLKEKRAIHAADHVALVEGVGPFLDARRARVFEPIHGVGPAVKDHGARGDSARFKTETLLAADGLGEAESEEADKGHEDGVDAENAHLLFPGALAILSLHAKEG